MLPRSTRPPNTTAAHSFGPQRMLKGHSNVVHLIDAAWRRPPNGTYEAFTPMEFCLGSQMIGLTSADKS